MFAQFLDYIWTMDCGISNVSMNMLTYGYEAATNACPTVCRLKIKLSYSDFLKFHHDSAS